MFLTLNKGTGKLGLSSHPLSSLKDMDERFLINCISGTRAKYNDPISLSTFNSLFLYCGSQEGIIDEIIKNILEIGG